MKQLLFTFCLVLLGSSVSLGQIKLGNQSTGNNSPQNQEDEFSYLRPQEYIISGVRITGTEYLDNEVLITISKLNVGNRIEVPGESISNAIKNLWAQGLFDDVAIKVDSVRDNAIFLNIAVVERPRLTRIDINGLSKTQTK